MAGHRTSTTGSIDVGPRRRPRAGLPILAVAVLLLTACGDDGETAVDAGASTTSIAATTTVVTTTTTVTTTSTGDGGGPGLDEFGAQCRDGDVSGCRQLSDVTLQAICDEGQTVACQTYGARTGEGDPDGDGTVAFEAGCRDGDFASCVQLTDATLLAICNEGQEAACQTYLSRQGDG